MGTEGQLVGIDIGTSTIKVGVVALDGRELVHSRCPTPWTCVATGAEIDPDALFAAVLATVAAALAQLPPAPVLGIGVTSMAETLIYLDGADRPLRPAVAWHDARGAEQASQLGDEIGEAAFTAATGLPVSRLCSLVKLRWLRDQWAGADRLARVLSVAEWVVHRLGGDPVAELSLASRTGMLDIRARAWWPAALDWAGQPPSILPPLVQAGSVVGRAAGLPPELAALNGAALTIAGHDHLCAAVGGGVLDEGALFDSCGSAEALIRASRAELSADQVARAVAGHVTVGWHVLPGHRALVGAQRAGLALQRFLALLGTTAEQRPALEDAALAAATRPSALRVTNPDQELSTLSGIGWASSPGEVWWAAVSAVAQRTAELLGTITEVSGPVREVLAAGGWTHSPALRAAKAAHLPQIQYPQVVEPGVRGAALLAGCAAAVFSDPSSVPRPPRAPQPDAAGS